MGNTLKSKNTRKIYRFVGVWHLHLFKSHKRLHTVARTPDHFDKLAHCHHIRMGIILPHQSWDWQLKSYHPKQMTIHGGDSDKKPHSSCRIPFCQRRANLSLTRKGFGFIGGDGDGGLPKIGHHFMLGLMVTIGCAANHSHRWWTHKWATFKTAIKD